MSKIRDYYTDLVDRAVKTAAQSAVLSVAVESAQVDGLAVDYKLMGGMALGGALLSVLTTLASRGLFGRGDGERRILGKAR
jgi:hypothetical protein